MLLASALQQQSLFHRNYFLLIAHQQIIINSKQIIIEDFYFVLLKKLLVQAPTVPVVETGIQQIGNSINSNFLYSHQYNLLYIFQEYFH
jgi:hypothetical protein